MSRARSQRDGDRLLRARLSFPHEVRYSAQTLDFLVGLHQFVSGHRQTDRVPQGFLHVLVFLVRRALARGDVGRENLGGGLHKDGFRRLKGDIGAVYGRLASRDEVRDFQFKP